MTDQPDLPQAVRVLLSDGTTDTWYDVLDVDILDAGMLRITGGRRSDLNSGYVTTYAPPYGQLHWVRSWAWFSVETQPAPEPTEEPNS